MLPTKMLITSTCFQVWRSNSLTVISLQNVFQMTPLVLQVHLQVVREIVNDTNTVLYGDYLV